MRWWLRLCAWSALLAPACWLASQPYQRWLAGAVTAVLPAFHTPVRVTRLDVVAPFDLGLFVALCLASEGAPLARRARAIAAGIPLLVIGEVLVVATAFAINFRAPADPQTAAIFHRAAHYLLGTTAWVGAAAVWLALLGTDLVRPRRATGRRPTAARGERGLARAYTPRVPGRRA